ncbi:MAG: glycosyltransferase [Actinobacteria bacterium]|nr:MAG: glycosyltransferase [Actinomycetota bacterium]
MATVVFFPEGAFGPTNNCVGIGDVLRRRGHRVVFIVEESFAGTLEAKGFEERLMRLAPPPAEPEVPGQFWKDFIRDTAPVFRRPTIEQLAGFIRPTWQALCDGARYVEPRLRAIIDDVGPDVIVEDNVVGFPALPASGRPWVRIVSCNPAELKDSDVPPTFSGYSADDRSGWGEFRAEYERTHRDLWNDFDAFMRSSGAPPLPDLEFIHESPALNLFLYPEEADYSRARRLGPTWHRLDSCVRATEDEWPELAAFEGDGLLVYLSLGSLGSADVDLMRRLVATLADSPHRFVVSKGPQHDRYELADNMRGAEFLPQTTILRHVDLVITHGGNNTVTECFHFGKPMIVLPLFWDQYDNAQRVDELGLGVRLDTYGHEPDELRGAVERLLADDSLRARMRPIAERLRASPGTVRAAELIEDVTS